MQPYRKYIILFWVFIGGMLLWQFYNYNHGMTQAAIDHPTQDHFYFYPPNEVTKPKSDAPPKPDGADVEQVGYTVEEGQPNSASFTCRVTLKNVGTAKALSVQVWVRPFRGSGMGDPDLDPHYHILTEDDTTSQFGQWVGFPDLAPGESSNETVSFLSRPNLAPGKNPDPKIVFLSEKPKP